ncbi:MULTISPECIES: hypothetical protein [Nisaea]|jgi:hypothetical protein|uniref:hypothetical protein n=1 Tax=Nisaea TaxID=390876 RepID=UPI001867B33A|nr:MULTISPECIES: hypothetical protein [Nisaea]MBO6561616.1 hypothetical protein [Nisaea sp.]
MTTPVQSTVAIFAFRSDKQQQLVQAQVVSSAVETAKQIAQSNGAQAASSGGVDITV